jgi:hypothetical protein
MSLLSLVTNFCARTALPIPVGVMGSTETQVIQLRSLLEEEGEDLASRGDWEGLVVEQSLTTIAAEDQGAITALAASGFRHIKNHTLWDRSRRLPVAGPMNPRQWQAMKAVVANGPYYRYRIRSGHLLVNPIPPAGAPWYFEYVTNQWILDTDGVTTKQYFTADTDTIRLPETLLLMGLRWRWKKEKGLEYAEDLRTYEAQVNDALSRDGGKPTLCMDMASPQSAHPGIFVPSGSWSLP